MQSNSQTRRAGRQGLRCMIRHKRILLLLLFLVLGLTNLDFNIALANTSSHQTDVAFEAQSTEPEELDCPEGPRHRHHVKMVIANTVTVGHVTGSCTPSAAAPLFPVPFSVQCPTQASLLASWLDKREEHISALKSEPLWLRYNALLI